MCTTHTARVLSTKAKLSIYYLYYKYYDSTFLPNRLSSSFVWKEIICGWVLQRDQGPVNVTASLRHTYLLGTSASSFFRLEETSFTTSVSKNYKYSDTRDTWTAFSLKHLILEIGRTDALPQIHFGHNL